MDFEPNATLASAYQRGYQKGVSDARSTTAQPALLRMHPGYVAWWISLIAVMLGADMLRAPDIVWMGLLAVFFAIEGVAAYRHQKGDTFSELMWTFRRGGPDRRWVMFGVAVYLPLQFARIGIPEIPFWLPRLVLAAAVAMWLGGHFSRMGKTG